MAGTEPLSKTLCIAMGSWDSICGITSRLRDGQLRHLLILGRGKRFFCPEKSSDWLWVPPSLLFNGYNAIMRVWPLKNLAELVDGPTLCACAALFRPSV